MEYYSILHRRVILMIIIILLKLTDEHEFQKNEKIADERHSGKRIW